MKLYKPTLLQRSLGLCALLMLTQASLAAEYKCWMNKQGVRECGSSVPPEYAQGRIEVVNERGLIIRVIEPAKTREQLEKEREQERLRMEREAIKREQERLDAILLNAYTTERDLLIARDTNLKSAQSHLDIAQSNLRGLQRNLSDLQDRAANFERSGKKVPDELLTEIAETEQDIAEKEQQIEKREAEKKLLEQRFEKDLQRFRELKGRPAK